MTDVPPSAPQKRPPLSKRWTFIILALTLLFIMMPFLFWRATWFGRPLTDAQLADVLNPKSNPHDIQHGLSQVSDRIVAHDPAISRFYPQVIALSSNPQAPIRTMAAWTMGQDNQSAAFHAALLPMLNDPDLTVRRNAALALVRFQDTSGHEIIVAMLKAAAIDAPASGTLQTRLKPSQTMNPGTLIAHIQTPSGEREVRAEIPGTLARWLLSDGATVSAGAHIAAVWPTDDEAWEALRALYLIGRPADLDSIAPYARGTENAPPQLAEQARLTMQAIRSRALSSSDPSSGLASSGQHQLGSCDTKTWLKLLHSAVPLSTSKLTELATHRVQPEAPILDAARIDATVRLRILVDKSGRVRCAGAVADPNPLLGELSTSAALQWQFRPFETSGQPKEVTGFIVFKIHR